MSKSSQYLFTPVLNSAKNTGKFSSFYNFNTMYDMKEQASRDMWVTATCGGLPIVSSKKKQIERYCRLLDF